MRAAVSSSSGRAAANGCGKSRGAQRSAQFAKADKPARRFVPQHQADARKALRQRKPADLRQLRMLAQHQRQPVIRNPAAEMVHMVNADIGGEPAQHGRQVIVRAAVQRRRRACSRPGRAPRTCPRTGAGHKTARPRSKRRCSMIGRCTSRNGTMPTAQIMPAATSAMARLVAMVLSQGRQPPRIRPTGRRCCRINR